MQKIVSLCQQNFSQNLQKIKQWLQKVLKDVWNYELVVTLMKELIKFFHIHKTKKMLVF